MRRRADSYVNATQILKVAGVDKGRRTKILEKEILPAPLFDFIPNSGSLNALPTAIQAGSGKSSFHLFPYLNLIFCRWSRELFTFFSSLCTDYARICTPSLEPGPCTRSFYSLNVPEPGAYLSPTTGSRLPWLSSPRCSRRVPYTSPDTAAQTDEIRDGGGFYRDS